MEKVTFYSYKPYLYVCLHRKRGIAVQFDKNCMCTLTGKNTINLLQEYAENTKNSYVVVKAGDMGLEELQRLHEEWENNLIIEAEEKERQKKVRIEDERERMRRELSEMIFR